jgi:hypothetical protein
MTSTTPDHVQAASTALDAANIMAFRDVDMDTIRTFRPLFVQRMTADNGCHNTDYLLLADSLWFTQGQGAGMVGRTIPLRDPKLSPLLPSSRRIIRNYAGRLDPGTKKKGRPRQQLLATRTLDELVRSRRVWEESDRIVIRFLLIDAATLLESFMELSCGLRTWFYYWVWDRYQESTHEPD